MQIGGVMRVKLVTAGPDRTAAEAIRLGLGSGDTAASWQDGRHDAAGRVVEREAADHGHVQQALMLRACPGSCSASEIATIMGGFHVSGYPQSREFLHSCGISTAVGEAENFWGEIIEDFLQGHLKPEYSVSEGIRAKTGTGDWKTF